MQFNAPSNSNLERLYSKMPQKVDEFMNLLEGETIIYIDYANIRPWSEKLGWHIDVKRLKQLFNAIDSIKKVRIYYGTLVGDARSQQLISELHSLHYEVTTKPVKKLRLSIDARTIPDIDPSLIKDFLRRPLLQKLTLDDIKYLNGLLYSFNTQGIYFLEDKKCNFDVEIGRDMLLDYKDTPTQTYILCGGDSDFESPIKQLLDDGKKVILLATARRIAKELSALENEGLIIFELKKLREYICWNREMTQ